MDWVIVCAVLIIIAGITILTVGNQRSTQSKPKSSPSTRSGSLPPPKSDVFTSAQLLSFNGINNQPVYIAVQNPFDTSEITVFDMTSGIDFYGPGSPYHVFAGRHASHGLAMSSTDRNDVEGDLNKLSASELDTLTQWYLKFESKYPKVGLLRENESGSSAGTTSHPQSVDSVQR
eukprot:CAMPEP_0182445156 /NCGR_PEP_ID=MMETSP1172-20130603/3385_1 /TAXON_ID=708627 /ORGANISM="Timspurckia oligopyrenoides, Strain CCMP3278" /LENGTH=174 /DNA_ID=CAMNT_0024640875 /DNA_START=54 /DNA_END=578 /DNA_ORIENTATION=-